MPHLLELFSGTGSVGKVFRARGWRVTAVDLRADFEPDICCNVLDLTPDMIPGHVDLLWASPPCTHYSIARTTAKTDRDLEGSDKLVRHVLDLAAQLLCPYFIENPHSGLLKTRDVVAGIPYRVVDYCMYADDAFPHKARKRTAVWTEPSRPRCRKNCNWCVDKRHVDAAQRGPSRRGGTRHTLLELYAIPPALVEDIAQWTGGRERMQV